MTDLIEVKTAYLVGEALGWAVGKAEGLDLFLEPPGYNGVPWRVFARYRGEAIEHTKRYNPWEDWALCGALQDKYVRLVERDADGDSCAITWRSTSSREGEGWGGTTLEAVCRSVVDLITGDTVQVPKELISCPD
ncbi:phage protein NinX family protein [Pseudomonas sp.]|uniref:phage protein NinX family protein n=1 Tax=Pseudomonas sp. TaxID=306 RepID=UPI003C73C186